MDAVKRPRIGKSANLLATLLLSFAFMGCDQLGTIYETVPSSATLLAQGGLVGTDISGTAQVYANQGTVLLHLEGLAMPQGSIYYLFLEDGSPTAPFYMSATKAAQGNQNYYTGKKASVPFSRVVLRVNGSPISSEVASAVLTQISVTPTRFRTSWITLEF